MDAEQKEQQAATFLYDNMLFSWDVMSKRDQIMAAQIICRGEMADVLANDDNLIHYLENATAKELLNYEELGRLAVAAMIAYSKKAIVNKAMPAARAMCWVEKRMNAVESRAANY